MRLLFTLGKKCRSTLERTKLSHAYDSCLVDYQHLLVTRIQRRRRVGSKAGPLSPSVARVHITRPTLLDQYLASAPPTGAGLFGATGLLMLGGGISRQQSALGVFCKLIVLVTSKIYRLISLSSSRSKVGTASPPAPSIAALFANAVQWPSIVFQGANLDFSMF